MRDYELVLVISPEAGEEQTTGMVGRITSFIEEQGGSVTNQEGWGVRRLAYPIKKFREGHYFITEFTLDPIKAVELEASVQASQEVLRHLMVKKSA